MPYRFERDEAEDTLLRKLEKVMPTAYDVQREAIKRKRKKVLDSTDYIKAKILPILNDFGLLGGQRIDHMNYARRLYRYYIMYESPETFDVASRKILIEGLGDPRIFPEVLIRIVNHFRAERNLPELKLDEFRIILDRRPKLPFQVRAGAGSPATPPGT